MRAVFTRQMAVLLTSDLSAEAALETIRSSGTSPSIEAAAVQAKAALLDGQPLSVALEIADAGFPPFYTAAVRAGEVSGDVASVFEGLADYLESVGSDRAQLATALIYPAFVAAVSLLVCGVLMTNVAPEIVAMFEVSGRPLPDLTRVVMAISDWIQANWVLLVGGFEAEALAEAVRSGESLSQGLARMSLIPPVCRQLIDAGEKSARLGRMTERAAVLVETWLTNERKRVAALLDPLLMMVVGGMVLVIVLAILLPIFDLQAVVSEG
ncbi:type II secretion system F family protein [Maritimibacter sp. 55A14]|uniref:type II secretion system F family protein n=1 Tax=Maritimibacter sp. 55A14 TaxID=2174844 RepID=UPI001E658D5C|nr:type II secretion system F family protein [Maritimibacter sp. 55A14]